MCSTYVTVDTRVLINSYNEKWRQLWFTLFVYKKNKKYKMFSQIKKNYLTKQKPLIRNNNLPLKIFFCRFTPFQNYFFSDFFFTIKVFIFFHQ